MANKNIAAKFSRLVDASRWSTYTLGEMLHCDPKTVSNWINAERSIPEEILTWLETTVTTLANIPAPDYREVRPPAGKPSRRAPRPRKTRNE
jgi:hypothetical protein